MGANLWGGSPLWEYRLGLIVSKSNHEPTGKGRPARACPEEARVQEVRGDGQKSHSQGRGMRGELAHGSEAHRYAAYGKCGACAPTVRVLTWVDLRSMAVWLLMVDNGFLGCAGPETTWR